jgi:hypothetical protein
MVSLCVWAAHDDPSAHRSLALRHWVKRNMNKMGVLGPNFQGASTRLLALARRRRTRAHSSEIVLDDVPLGCTCYNNCTDHINNGLCDDGGSYFGGHRAASDLCALGTDCGDCVRRCVPNPALIPQKLRDRSWSRAYAAAGPAL